MLGYGYLEVDGEQWRNGFMASRATRAATGWRARSSGAQISGRKRTGCSTLRTANEVRLTQMLALNQGYGYVPLYTELVLRGPCA